MLSKPIIIDNFQKGVGESPNVGFGNIINLDISTDAGSVRINNRLDKKSGTTITGLPLWQIRDASANLWCLDSGNKVYKSTDGGNTWSLVSGNTTVGNGNGIIYWKDHILVMGNNAIDGYGPLSGTPAWNNAFLNFLADDTVWHPTIVGQDDIVYIGDGRYIASLKENAGQNFDDGNAATYTFNSSALDLPEDYRVKCLVELGTNLLIGTWKGTNLYDYKIADIFPWDRLSDSFSIPIRLDENGVNAMINISNTVYIFAGITGNIYATNGSVIQKIKELPNTDFSDGSWIHTRPGAVINHNGKLYFGVSAGGGDYSPIGIWSYDIKTGILVFENKISTGNISGSVAIGSLFSVSGDVFTVGWSDTGSVQGIDSNSSRVRYTSYGAYLESQFYRIGTKRQPATLEQFEIHLDRVLATGQGIKLHYRKNINDSWTLIDTFDFATYGAISSRNISLSITDIVNIQFKVELTTGSSTSTTPRLLQVILQ